MSDLTYNPGEGLRWYDDLEDEYYCAECGAEDVMFLPHKPGCSEKGDVLPKVRLVEPA